MELFLLYLNIAVLLAIVTRNPQQNLRRKNIVIPFLLLIAALLIDVVVVMSGMTKGALDDMSLMIPLVIINRLCWLVALLVLAVTLHRQRVKRMAGACVGLAVGITALTSYFLTA